MGEPVSGSYLLGLTTLISPNVYAQGSARNEGGFAQMPPPEGHQVQMQRMTNNRMFRTMSVPHMAMGPGQQQSMYGTYDGQVSNISWRHHLCVAHVNLP